MVDRNFEQGVIDRLDLLLGGVGIQVPNVPSSGGTYDVLVEIQTEFLNRLDQILTNQSANGSTNSTIFETLQDQMDTITALQATVATLQAQIATLQTATDGTALPTAYDQTAKPGNPNDGELWLQRSSTGYPLEIWQWNELAEKWLTYASHQAHLRFAAGPNNNPSSWFLLGGINTATYGIGDTGSTNFNFLTGDGLTVTRTKAVFTGNGVNTADDYHRYGWTIQTSGLSDANVYEFINSQNYVGNANATLRPVREVSTDFNVSFTNAQLFTGDHALSGVVPGFRVASRAVNASPSQNIGLLLYLSYKSYLNP